MAFVVAEWLQSSSSNGMSIPCTIAAVRVMHGSLILLGRLQVLDLVHPSLYPIVYGVTRQLSEPMPPGISTWKPFLGQGEALKLTTFACSGRLTSFVDKHRCGKYDELHLKAPDGGSLQRDHRRRAAMRKPKDDLFDRTATGLQHVSSKYAWLPADVAIADDGTAKFESYINNLHPDAHNALYTALEQLLGACVPLLELTLQQAHVMPHKAISFDMDLLRSDGAGANDESGVAFLQYKMQA